jgi:subtilisin family serine protease
MNPVFDRTYQLVGSYQGGADFTMATITINGNSLDPLTQTAELQALGLDSADSSDSDYILIQAKEPLAKDQKQQLRDLGVEIQEYVPDDTYIAYYSPTDLSSIRQLPFVAWAGLYPKQVKVEPILRSQQSQSATPARVVNALTAPAAEDDPLAHDPKTVDVVFHAGVQGEAIREQLAQAAGLDPSSIKIEGQKARLTVSARRLDSLANIDGVRHIEEFSGSKLYNDVAGKLIKADVVQSGPSAFVGNGEIVAVCDTGLDSGNPSQIHPAFTGRVAKLYPLARPSANDPHGHGTHVSGSVLGDGKLAGGARIRGTAPGARLVLQSVLNANGGLTLPSNLNDLFGQPYSNDKARVHSNSWGDVVGDGSYSQQSREVDEFVWNHRDCVICFAAGNDGADRSATGKISPGSVGAPSTAKNCITVGASESKRSLDVTYHRLNSGKFPVNPIASDQIANNPEGVAAFSGRGPTRDHRIKPDVVAPGSTILSAKSRLATANPLFGTSTDPDYMFDAGTSMATPLVAGCAAVVRESFRVRRGITPSAALVKAMLINGASPLKGQYVPPELTPVPNESEGFGRVDLASSLAPLADSTAASFWDEATKLDVGEKETRKFTVTSDGKQLKVTLVWTDPPGEALQNDLDLIVRDVHGSERHGNMPQASTDFDRANNVEQVLWSNIAKGEVEITVSAFRIPVSPQSYALVIRVL